MATSEQRQEAYKRGWEFGTNQALSKQARIVQPPMYGSALGELQSDGELRAAFDQGFFVGYDTAAKGMEGSTPGATTVLKKVTVDETKKAEGPYGARQTDLRLSYDAFDNLVNSDLAIYSDVEGGLKFLSEWKIVKAEFAARNAAGAMTAAELDDSERKLNEMKSAREVLAGKSAEPKASPFSFLTLPGWDSKDHPMTPGGTNVPAKPPVAAPVKAGLFGLSRNALIALGLVTAAAVGGGVYLATRNDETEMERGPDGVWRPKRPSPVPVR